ncbi:MAG: endolytic transglycosylase MltG [Lachnospiraceae bacterium]|jgi:cell division protein YceG involved in septum cleavage|nr:endolytic transglycosylase MltG [Lachnospiraceae bacterium]MBP3240966.1 endolytic transglycosylase MltG [Oribacterium sp.]
MGQDTLERVTSFLIGLAWRVIVIALLVYALMNGVRAAYSYGHGLLYDHAMAGENAPETEFVITDEQTVEDISEALLKGGFIDNAEAFRVKSKLYEAEYVPGLYTISKSMTAVEIIQYLTQEGKKNRELMEKNLVDAEAATTAASEAEDGIEVIGGTEDENMIAQDAAAAVLESQAAESAAQQFAGGNASAGSAAQN